MAVAAAKSELVPMTQTEYDKLRMIYLFLAVEGKFNKNGTLADTSEFHKWGNQFDDFYDEEKNIIADCVDYLNGERPNRFGDDPDETESASAENFNERKARRAVKEAMMEIADNSFYDRRDRVQLIWMLLNTAYSDGSFGQGERDIMQTLTTKWNINETLLLEMTDTLETLLALEKHREWTMSVTKSAWWQLFGRKARQKWRDTVIPEYDKDQQVLTESIKDLIAIDGAEEEED